MCQDGIGAAWALNVPVPKVWWKGFPRVAHLRGTSRIPVEAPRTGGPDAAYR